MISMGDLGLCYLWFALIYILFMVETESQVEMQNKEFYHS